MTDFFLFISDTAEKQGEARGQRRGEGLSERRHHLSSPFSLPSCIRTFHRPGLPTQTQNWEMQKAVRRELEQRVQSSGWVASIWRYAAPSTDKDAAVEQKAKTKTSHSDADTGANWSAGRPGDDTTIAFFGHSCLLKEEPQFELIQLMYWAFRSIYRYNLCRYLW